MRIPQLPPNGKDNKCAFVGMRKEKVAMAIKDKAVHSFIHAPLTEPGAHLTIQITWPPLLELIYKKDFLPRPIKFSVVTNLQILKTYSFTLKDKGGYADTHFLITGSGCLLERAQWKTERQSRGEHWRANSLSAGSVDNLFLHLPMARVSQLSLPASLLEKYKRLLTTLPVLIALPHSILYTPARLMAPKLVPAVPLSEFLPRAQKFHPEEYLLSVILADFQRQECSNHCGLTGNTLDVSH